MTRTMLALAVFFAAAPAHSEDVYWSSPTGTGIPNFARGFASNDPAPPTPIPGTRSHWAQLANWFVAADEATLVSAEWYGNYNWDHDQTPITPASSSFRIRFYDSNNDPGFPAPNSVLYDEVVVADAIPLGINDNDGEPIYRYTAELPAPYTTHMAYFSVAESDPLTDDYWVWSFAHERYVGRGSVGTLRWRLVSEDWREEGRGQSFRLATHVIPEPSALALCLAAVAWPSRRR